MDAELEVDDITNRGGLDRANSTWSSCNPDGSRAGSGDDDEDDDDMFNVPVQDALMSTNHTEGPVIEDRLQMSQFADCTINSLDDVGLFVPTDKFDFAAEVSRVEMPDLAVEQLPVGSHVWVTDEMDVRMQLGDGFEGHHILPVCNGRKGGIVKRHQDRLTMVEFYDQNQDLTFAVTLPRRCLSLEKFDAYESAHPSRAPAMSINVGGLAPRAAGGGAEKRKEVVNLLQQFCEVVEVITPSQMAEEAWTLFNKRKFSECIESLGDVLDYAQSSNNDKLVLEARTLRSFAHFYSGHPDRALQDALASIDANPSWAQGYIRASRAYCALGKLQTGIEMLNQAALFLPHSTTLKRSVNLLHHIKTLQRHLDRYHLQYTVDENYVKRLSAKRGFQPGEVVVADEDVVVGAPSIENNGVCCEMCMGHGVGVRPGPVPSLSPKVSSSAKGVNFYDCQRCQRRSGYFLSLELDRASRFFDFAFGMLQNKAAKTADLLSIERARLASRLFYILYSKCCLGAPTQARASTSSINPNGPVDSSSELSPSRRVAMLSDPYDLLPAMGLFPIPSVHLDQKTTDNLSALHGMITGFMTEEERTVFNKDFFVEIFVLVTHYAVHIEGVSEHGSQSEALSIRLAAFEVPREGSLSTSSLVPPRKNVNVSGYVIASIAGCVNRTSDPEKINCSVVAVSPGKIVLRATRVITSGERLYIPDLRTGRGIDE